MVNWYMTKVMRTEFIYGYGVLDRYNLKGGCANIPGPSPINCYVDKVKSALKYLTIMILLQLAILLVCIFIGARMSGIGLGVMGMIGLLILLFAI